MRNSDSEIIVMWAILMLLVAFDFARKNNSWTLSRLMNGCNGCCTGRAFSLNDGSLRKGLEDRVWNTAGDHLNPIDPAHR